MVSSKFIGALRDIGTFYVLVGINLTGMVVAIGVSRREVVIMGPVSCKWNRWLKIR